MKIGSLDWPRDRIAAFCQRWQVSELSVFGSALRGELRPDSDIDLLITFTPEAAWSLLDHMQMKQELTNILGRKVELVSRRGVESSHNAVRRTAILSSAEPVYHEYDSVDLDEVWRTATRDVPALFLSLDAWLRPPAA